MAQDDYYKSFLHWASTLHGHRLALFDLSQDPPIIYASVIMNDDGTATLESYLVEHEDEDKKVFELPDCNTTIVQTLVTLKIQVESLLAQAHAEKGVDIQDLLDQVYT